MIDTDLLRQLGAVRRARGFRLYLQNGKRVVDLYQEGGMALLGHNPGGVILSVKNTLDRGLLASFPNVAQARLEKALSRLLPDSRTVRLYATRERAEKALSLAALPPLAAFPDPASGDVSGEVSLWRPCLPLSSALSPVLQAVLPFPLSPVAFLVDGACAQRLPPSDLISPVIAQGTLSAVEHLLREEGLRGKVFMHRSFSALAEEGSLWQKRGIYLTHCGDAGAYAGLFGRFLEGGFLLPPSPAVPAILPDELSDGEDAALAKLLRFEGKPGIL